MNDRDLRIILALPLLLLLFLWAFSVLTNYQALSGYDGTYWIRLDSNETPPDFLNRTTHSVRILRRKGSTIVSTVVSTSDDAAEAGFQEGDLDFYGDLEGEVIKGSVHYKSAFCELDIYSPMTLKILGSSDDLSGEELVPSIDPFSCRPYPQSNWTRKSYKLHRIELPIEE